MAGLKRRRKGIFPFFLSSLPFGFVYILLITLTIAYLISFHTLSLRCSLGGKGETTSPNLLPYFFCCHSVQASRQSSAFSLSLGAGALQDPTLFISVKRGICTHFLNLCICIGNLEFYRLDGLFCSFFPFFHCFFCYSAD